MRSYLHLLGSLLLGVTGLSTARAQFVWTRQTAPTTQDLWGATWTGTQFVVVGNGGTLLTSPDGQTWTARTSGTTEWLLGASYAADLQRYVVVGDHGTILTSSDAITWTPRSSGTTERLNGIARGSGRFVAVGEHSTVVTSTDGVTWAASKVAAAGWLRGIAYVKDRFYFGGSRYPDDTPSVPMANYTTVDGTTFTEVDVASWGGASEAIYTDGITIVAAGSGGYVVVTAPASFPLVPTIRYDIRNVSPTLVFPFAGQRAVIAFNGFWISAGNNGVIKYQPVDGSTVGGYTSSTASPSPTFYAAAASPTVAIVAGSGGSIALTVAEQKSPTLSWNSSVKTTNRVVAGNSITLETSAVGSPPMSYQWRLNGQPIAGATNATLTLANADGTQSGLYTVTATNALGTQTLDPRRLVVVTPVSGYAEQTIDASYQNAPSQSWAAALEGGRSLVFTSANGSWNLQRLDADGHLDPTFQTSTYASLPSLQVLTNGQLLLVGAPAHLLSRLNADGAPDPTFASTTNIDGQRIVALADNRILLLKTSANVLTATRLLANGSADSSYPTPTLVLAPPASSGVSFDPDYSVGPVVRLSNGEYFIAAVSEGRASGIAGYQGRDATLMLRAHADGEVEPTPIVTLNNAVWALAAANGKVYSLNRRGSGGIDPGQVLTTDRLFESGASDPAYTKLTFAGSVLSPLPQVTLQADGSVWAGKNHQNTELIRYDPDGKLDLNFGIRLLPTPATATLSVSRLDATHALVTGAFTALNGVAAPGMTRIFVDPVSTTHLANLSIRQVAGTGDNTLTLGLVVAGTGSRTMLVRAVGPTLADFNVPGTLADPQLRVVAPGGATVASNDDWQSGAASADVTTIGGRMGAFPLRDKSRDAATVVTLGSGNYTLQVGTGQASDGVALAEGYDADPAPTEASTARIVNFSARAMAGSGAATLTAGFSIEGRGTVRVLIRGVGPSLAKYGVNGSLADPMLSLYRGSTVIEFNDNVDSSTSTVPGAFPISGTDAAIAVTLPAGTYTAQVASVTGETGIALVEIYELR